MKFTILWRLPCSSLLYIQFVCQINRSKEFKKKRFLKKYILFTHNPRSLGVGAHDIYNFQSPFPTDAAYQIWSRLAHFQYFRRRSFKRTTNDARGRTPTHSNIGDLSDSGDLKICQLYDCPFILSVYCDFCSISNAPIFKLTVSYLFFLNKFYTYTYAVHKTIGQLQRPQSQSSKLTWYCTYIQPELSQNAVS